ncbi:hypothetical protein GUJ93_ZPchr0012g22026 [Zizania palustris]|uniref:Uncharacterized protein n=1 Tax=Zizania palustris TaxID=103762 RepID=A0A8J5WJZ7_ZIZPA|nr:hypothetical protein GUJ93_ZPchr0012g22026 [Zizania palustris]
MSNTTGGEQTQTHALPLAPRVAGGGKEKKVGSPEKVLNGFVRLVAVIERLGNAMGTLAFTWATVILLGGYPVDLRSEDDFLYATIIVFLEATSDLDRLAIRERYNGGDQVQVGNGAGSSNSENLAGRPM